MAVSSGGSRVTCKLDNCSCKRTSCALWLGLHWAVRSCGGCSTVSLPAHLHHPWDRSRRRRHRHCRHCLLEKPNQHSSSNYCWWATSFYQYRLQSHKAPFRARDGKTERMEWQARSGKERDADRERKSKNVVTSVQQLVKPSMLNFAKTDAELRPACALLILTTYARIKKHLLTNWHAWINHRAILKGTMNSLSWQTWQFSLTWQMSSEYKKATRSVIISIIIRRAIKDSAEDRLCFCFVFLFFSRQDFFHRQKCAWRW